MHIVLTDDLDGSDAAGTVSFGLDGNTYEIELSEQNATRLRDHLQPFVAKARKVGGSAPTRSGRRASEGSATDIRAWAQAQGMTVSSRGRVPAEIRRAYENRQR